jgi:gamma-glutamyl hercynylcysteine S-oxide synthase
LPLLLGAGAVLLVVAVLILLQSGIFQGPPATRSAQIASETPNSLTRAVENLTATAAAEITAQAPTATATPNEVQTLMAEIRASETARFSTLSPPTATPTPAPTLDMAATARADATQAELFQVTRTIEAQAQSDQQRANTPTITPLPTHTATATVTPSATSTPTPRLTATPSPDVAATNAEVIANETRIYQAALATSEAGNIIAIYENPDNQNLIVRDAPGGNILATVAPGSRLTITEKTENQDWSAVRLANGLTGWSAANLLTELGTPTPVPDPETMLRLAQVGVERNADWQPYIQSVNGVDMALVPAGCFNMGSGAVADERPVHEQCITQPYWVDVHEISNAQFAALNGQAARESATTEDNEPRTFLTWDEAQTFCEAARGARLPTELEWEYAARGPSARVHTWEDRGDMLSISLRVLNFCDASCEQAWRNASYEDRFATAAPVGSFPAGASWVAALDLNGNVWEWVSTIYAIGAERFAYPYVADDGREALEAAGALRVVRGGSWISAISETRSANRDRYDPRNRIADVGFRCVRPAAANP